MISLFATADLYATSRRLPPQPVSGPDDPEARRGTANERSDHPNPRVAQSQTGRQTGGGADTQQPVVQRATVVVTSAFRASAAVFDDRASRSGRDLHR
ncbi:hypothetical protein FXW78_51440 [Rhodococcus opacus]|nr:hypothetical protein [Rhodococcus opacus]